MRSADRGARARGGRAELARTRYEASTLHRRPGDGRCLGVTLDREVIHAGIPVRALVDDPAASYLRIEERKLEAGGLN